MYFYYQWLKYAAHSCSHRLDPAKVMALTGSLMASHSLVVPYRTVLIRNSSFSKFKLHFLFHFSIIVFLWKKRAIGRRWSFRKKGWKRGERTEKGREERNRIELNINQPKSQWSLLTSQFRSMRPKRHHTTTPNHILTNTSLFHFIISW